MVEIAKKLRLAPCAMDVSTFFLTVDAIKQMFKAVERRVVDEHFFLNFMMQCERSDLLLAALYEEYLKAKIRYKWLTVLNK